MDTFRHVIPAKASGLAARQAGIYGKLKMDPRFRGDDKQDTSVGMAKMC